jgi:exopolyphosphatase
MASPLLNFLAQARSALLRPATSIPLSIPHTLVLGNPSCDLDSFISATVYSYFHSKANRSHQSARLHIPILNLPSISSSDLWRMRPEFGTALRLALHGQDAGDKNFAKDVDKCLLENLLTISDIRSTSSSSFKYLFSDNTRPAARGPAGKISVVLVDHNALSIPLPNMSTSEISTNLDINGCIDHHIDEDIVPSTASPRIIKTGIGSCTSLVVQYLMDEGFWGNLTGIENKSNETDQLVVIELAKLSLASILMDTTNLTAEGKVSETDREIVSFLEDVINNTSTTINSSALHFTKETQVRHWDRYAFFEQISESKANSLSLLNLSEIFDRDYKAWAEKPNGSDINLNLGVASVVKPIDWLIKKAESFSPKDILDAMHDFAQEQEPKLDLFAIMTTSTSLEGKFQRELLVISTGHKDESQRALERFEKMGKDELKLCEWKEDEHLVDLLEKQRSGNGKIWWQRDISRSRKQVAPLLREAMRSV